MGFCSYRFRDRSTGYWELPRTHNSDSLALAEGSGRLRLRRDPKAAIALLSDPLLERRLLSRSDTKRKSRHTFRSKRMRHESKFPDSGDYPRRRCQIPLTWYVSMTA